MSPSAVAKYELLKRQPPAEVIIGSEFIFDTAAEELFPALVGSVRAAVFLNAQTLLHQLGEADDAVTKRKLEILQSIISRVEAR